MDIKDYKVDKYGKVRRGWSISEESFLKLKELAFDNDLSDNKMLEKCILEFGSNSKEAKKKIEYPSHKCAIKFGENGYK
jgi:hypothetical protein